MSAGDRSARIDVLRGISIVLVLLHHFNIAYRMNDTPLANLVGWQTLDAVFRNGNYAVTMFFAISGFLITSNAERRWHRLHNINALAFYRLRAARIIPCMLLLLLSVNALAAFGIDIFRNHPEFGGVLPFWIVDLASMTFWMNVLIGHAGWLNYALCVLWSLSVEEVFYLAFPILCLTLRREARLLAAWSVFIIVGPIWRAMHVHSEYGELYAYLACFDGIAFGCCAAVLRKYVRLPVWGTAPVCTIVALAMSWFYLSAWIAQNAVYGVSLMAFGTSILLLAQDQYGRAATQASVFTAPVRQCGRLSYELYLFHLIVLGALRTIWVPASSSGSLKLVLLVAYVLLSLALAGLISKYYAEPLRRGFRASHIGPGTS